MSFAQASSAIAFTALLVLASSGHAQDAQVPQVQSAPSPATAAPPTVDPQQKPALMRGNCWTSQPDCAGVANYSNRSSQYVSCAVYFNDGANGVSNFVLPPGGTHGIHVRTGDTTACVWGNSGVPNDTPRKWIWVS